MSRYVLLEACLFLRMQNEEPKCVNSIYDPDDFQASVIACPSLLTDKQDVTNLAAFFRFYQKWFEACAYRKLFPSPNYTNVPLGNFWSDLKKVPQPHMYNTPETDHTL